MPTPNDEEEFSAACTRVNRHEPQILRESEHRVNVAAYLRHRFLAQALCPLTGQQRLHHRGLAVIDTGLRRGEMIGLRREDVALPERVLYVRRSIGAYDDPDEANDDESHLTTKTEAGERIVSLLDGALAALEEVLADAKDMRDEAPVFATIERKRGRDGVVRPTGRPLSPRMVTRVFRRYADRAGLPETIRLHDLRHTAITNAISQGEDILIVAAFAGHAKTSTTVDVYSHLLPKRTHEAARRMRSVMPTRQAA